MDSRLLVEDDEGDAQTKAEDEQEEVALRGARHGEHVVHGHGDVGDDNDPHGLPDRADLPVDFLSRRPLDEELHGDPEDEETPDELQVGGLQKLGREEGENDPQEDRGAGADQDSLLALLAGKRANRHGDDHGIVPGEDQVDQDDAQEGGDELPAEADMSQQIRIHGEG